MNENKINNIKRVNFFDTTLRDGEQTPGVSLNLAEKLEIAKNLERLGVNIIEAGFAASSPGDFEAVSGVADVIKNAQVASLSRCAKADIEASAKALEKAVKPCIHVFIATSEVHMKYKLKMEPEKVLEKAIESVRFAKSLCDNVEFSCEDASRSESAFMYKVLEAVINEGATVVNIPDTVGYSTPNEFFNIIKGVKDNVKNIDNAIISVHCHNDLGMAVANSLAAIEAGAGQVECTVNGIGERAGNASLEEIVMALKTREDFYKAKHTIETINISKTSQVVSNLTGVAVSVYKPIVGWNAFRHASGIHQHGVLSEKSTYEIMTPESIGLTEHNHIVLGKLSGRHAFESKLKELELELDNNSLNQAFDLFKITADRKKDITDEDIIAIVSEIMRSQIGNGNEAGKFELESYEFNKLESGETKVRVKINKKEKQSILSITEEAIGDGIIDGAFKAINKIANKNDLVLESYNTKSASGGTDALAVADVIIKYDGKLYKGAGTSTDTIEASIKAYVNAVNRVL